MLHVLRKHKEMTNTQSLLYTNLIFVMINSTCRWDIYVEIPKQSFGNRCVELRESDKIYIV